MANNYGPMHTPRIVRNLFGVKTEDRTKIRMVGLSSSAHYLGAFVPLIQGSSAAPTGAELGIPAFADDNLILGFVTGFYRHGSDVPIQDDPGRAGTITDATGELPMKYTFGAANDQASTTSATAEEVEIMPIHPGDILEVSLWGASTASVDRGTTTAYGTTTSSANLGVGMSVNATYPFSLLESTAAKNLANLDFITVQLDGKSPVKSNRVYAIPLRTVFGRAVAD